MKRPSPRGRLFVIAAPSGAGKTSLVRALMEQEAHLQFSISFTTRARRPSEVDGHDYFFVDVPTFQRMAATGEFLEHAQVFDNYYATGHTTVETALAAGQDLILEIDWQGARQVRTAMPECISIFILPLSRETLEERLRGRGTDSPEVIARRLQNAVADMSHWREFEYVIVNDSFDQALADLHAVVSGAGEGLRGTRPELEPLAASLLA